MLKKVQWFAENLRFAFTGDPSVVKHSMFERYNRRFTGSAALELYEAQLKAQEGEILAELRQRWQGDDSPDYRLAEKSIRKQVALELADLRQQFATGD